MGYGAKISEEWQISMRTIIKNYLSEWEGEGWKEGKEKGGKKGRMNKFTHPRSFHTGINITVHLSHVLDPHIEVDTFLRKLK